MQTNKKVESLESEVKALTQVVHKMAREPIDNNSPQSKRRGGRIGVSQSITVYPHI